MDIMPIAAKEVCFPTLLITYRVNQFEWSMSKKDPVPRIWF